MTMVISRTLSEYNKNTITEECVVGMTSVWDLSEIGELIFWNRTRILELGHRMKYNAEGEWTQ